MKDHTPTRSWLVGILTVSIVLLTGGCATQSRLGYLIPKNENSDRNDDETILIELKTSKTTKPPATFVIPSVVGAFVAEQAIKYVANELDKEAEKYEASFSRSMNLRTDHLSEGTNSIYLTRWVKSRSGPSNYPGITDADATDYLKGVKKRNALVERKQPAFLLRLQIVRQATSTGPYAIRPDLLWNWQSKAKVVDFRESGLLKPWEWVGALLLKTSDKVRYNVNVGIKALVKAKDSNSPAMSDVFPLQKVVSDHMHKLRTAKEYSFKDNAGTWFDIPTTYSQGETTNHIGFFTIEVQVTEADASNVPQKLKKASGELRESSKSWADKVGDWIEGK